MLSLRGTWWRIICGIELSTHRGGGGEGEGERNRASIVLAHQMSFLQGARTHRVSAGRPTCPLPLPLPHRLIRGRTSGRCVSCSRRTCPLPLPLPLPTYPRTDFRRLSVM